MNRLPLLSLCAAAHLVLACPSPEERAESAREAAREALSRGDRDEAVAALGELRASQPETPEAQIELAALLVQAGEGPQAVWLLEEAAGRHPDRDDLRAALASAALLVNNPSLARSAAAAVKPESEHHARALLTLALAELQLGNLERALSVLEEAEAAHPEAPELTTARIATLLREGRAGEARTALDTARQSETSEEGRVALRRLEIALHQLDAADGDAEAAIAGLRELVDEDPDDLAAWRGLVEVLYRAGRSREALEQVRVAVEESPGRIGLRPVLARLEVAHGEWEAAEQVLREFADLSASPSAYLQLAEFHAARQDVDAALAVYEEALTAFPNEAPLRKSRTEMLLDFGRVEDAVAELARLSAAVPEDDPNVAYLGARIQLAEGDAAAAARALARLVPRFDVVATQYWLGRALEATGDRAGAERRYVQATQRQPSHPGPYRDAIRMAQLRGDWQGTAGYAQLLVRRQPGLPDGWVALATALLHLGQTENAEKLARTGVEAFPRSTDLSLVLVRALRARGEHAEALELLADASERTGAPKSEVEAERAITLGVAGRVDEGIAAAREALDASPDSARLHLALAALLFEAGEAQEGATAVDRALELDPDDSTPLALRARFRASIGLHDDARADCERYLALRPDDATVQHLLGVIHTREGRNDEAIAAYRRAAELDLNAAAPRNNLANLLADRGDVDGALAAAQEAFALAGDDPDVIDTLGWLYLTKGLVDRSISLLEDAHASAPEKPEVQLHLALAYRQAGRVERARELLTELQARGGENGALRGQVEEALDSLP